ncbi:unnamed protein product [Rhizophagus irregularis]|nr:unnamed protein product [Rhizophagus irregularis]CAB5392054.1 unnamed protein product [Rhizophagus irregularis]
MEQCWNANPLERPNIKTLRNKIREIKFYYLNNPNELPQLKAKIDKEINHANTSSKLFTSKIHKYDNLPEPKNATEEEQEAFHSKLYDFNIPENIDDFGQSSNQNNKRNSNVIEAGNTRLTKVFKKLRVNSSKSDDDEYNNPNLHSEEQEEFEIPNMDSKLFYKLDL